MLEALECYFYRRSLVLYTISDQVTAFGVVVTRSRQAITAAEVGMMLIPNLLQELDWVSIDRLAKNTPAVFRSNDFIQIQVLGLPGGVSMYRP